MKRRKFLGLGAGIVVASLIPAELMAKNFRTEKPDAWKIVNGKDDNQDGTNKAIKAVFGTDKVEEGKASLKAPDIAENGAVIPITAKAENATKIAIFQSANPESLVAVFDVPKNGIPEYSLRIKMQKTGTVTVVAEVDGKLYKASKAVKVTIGGCGG